MKDRFKFRAWDKKAKKIINWDNDLEWHALRTFDVNKSNLEFMQCTGLKDKNGKLIFEGDIFTVLHCGEKKVVVFWDDEQARFKVKNAAHNLFETIRSDYLEVIGNIYENPELLKGGE